MPEDRIRNRRLSPIYLLAHLCVLGGFAVAQPLYDLFSRSPEFFVAHGSQPIDLVLLVLLLSLGIPLAAWGLVRISSLYPAAGRAAVFLSVLLLSGAFSMLVLKKLVGDAGFGLVIGGVAAGGALAWLYQKFPPFGTLLTVLSPAILVFPALFLFDPQVAKVAFPSGDSSVQGEVSIGNPAPVIMVVFDELPTISLLDETRHIDSVRFPNFHALAREGYWFRNASTVSDMTLIAVPAILDGLDPTPEAAKLPLAADHPRNLFSLLQESYQLTIQESGTRLAPSRASTEVQFGERIRALLTDTAYLYLHLLLPQELANRYLPPVTQSWRDFGSTGASGVRPKWGSFKIDWRARDKQFENFVSKIEKTPEPQLYFLHSTIPHASWRYLPSGRQYSLHETESVRGVVGANDRGNDPNQWIADPWVVIQGQQRHLLQSGYADKLLGDLVSRLREVDLYDESLIVVTADHGTSFLPGESRRLISRKNFPGIMMVPLLVKLPGQRDGKISDLNVSTVDILPTIIDVLQAEVSWTLDGHSVLDESFPARMEKVVVSDNRRRSFDRWLPAERERLQSKIDLFGSGDWDKLYEAAPIPGLVGKTLEELRIGPAAGGLVEVDGEDFFREVDPEASFILTRVAGSFSGLVAGTKPGIVAVAVNGVVRAVTRADSLEGDLRFSALVPESSFVEGRNSVAVFRVDSSNDRLALRPIAKKAAPRFELGSSETGEFIRTPDGVIPIRSDQGITGWLNAELDEENRWFRLGGWAADMKEIGPAESILIFLNGRALNAKPIRTQHRGVVKDLGRVELLESGFRIQFPLSSVEDPPQTEVRIFAVSRRGLAGELHYPRGEGWPFKPNPRNEIDPFTRRLLSLAREARESGWGLELRFRTQDLSASLLKEGWGRLAEGHVWTTGQRASLALSLEKPILPVRLAVTVIPYIPEASGHIQKAIVELNGRRVGEWMFESGDLSERELILPEDFFAGNGSETILTFITPDARAPSDLAAGTDKRSLGLAFFSLRLSYFVE